MDWLTWPMPVVGSVATWWGMERKTAFQTEIFHSIQYSRLICTQLAFADRTNDVVKVSLPAINMQNAIVDQIYLQFEYCNNRVGTRCIGNNKS